MGESYKDPEALTRSRLPVESVRETPAGLRSARGENTKKALFSVARRECVPTGASSAAGRRAGMALALAGGGRRIFLTGSLVF